MKITAEQLRLAKEAPNSCYDLIKAQFLLHSNRLEGSTFSPSRNCNASSTRAW